MTTRIFRAAGTLAAALVFLAGCDSASPTADSSGLSQTANLDLPQITGPANLPELCLGDYSVAPNRPTTGTFSIAYGPGAITTQSTTATLSTATVQRTAPTGTIRLLWTATGSSTAGYSRNIGSSGNACG